jgi:eukaryotic-like serine/threonine-protein kinase
VTPERWQNIRDLLEQALELPPEQRAGLLDRSCKSDSSLRHEVEILLASSEDVRTSFMQSQPPRAALPSGTKLGEYEIKSLLGAGGMGEVYRAHDSRLGRDVAIKILPSSFSADSNRLRRFEQEARAAAALNHPNILAVFQMGTHNGAPYLVSELLEGETLRELLQRGRLTVRQVIDSGVQVAHGLSAAHEKGIVHRDLKPENLFVTRDGRTKILDFGLARLTRPLPSSQESALTAGETEPGLVMGTVGYMSPEQVRGQTADYRTDIFSFGTILFEMLCGKRAFQKPTSPETMNAILNEDPPQISQIAANISPALQRVVHRCLEKNPEQRFQSASDLAFALDALSETSGSSTTIPKSAARRVPKLWAIPAVLVAVAAAVVGFVFFTEPAPLKLGRVTQLTSDGRTKMYVTPALVTDGARLYFGETVSGQEAIKAVSTSGGDTSPVPTTLPFIGLYDISPDGSELLINSGDADIDNPLWLLPLPGGSPRRLGNLSAFMAAWSPDGRQIAYAKGLSELYIADANGANSRKLLSKENLFPSAELMDVVFSPDGTRIRVVVYNRPTSRNSFWDVNVEGSNLHQVLSEDWNNGVGKHPGRWTLNGKYFIFQVFDEKQSDLWALRDCTHSWFWCKPSAFQLTNGPLRYAYPLPSKDGKRLFVGGGLRRAEVVRYDSHLAQFSSFFFGLSAAQLNFSSDGQWVTWIGYPESTLWCRKADGSDRRQLTYSPLIVNYPRWSKDGSRITFTGGELGKMWRIYTISRDGGTAEAFPAGQTDQFDSSWGPNDSAIVFGGRESPEESLAITVRDLKTGKATELPGSQHLWQPLWSPDGRSIAALSRNGNRLFIFDVKAGKWSEAPAAHWAVGDYSFSHDSKSIYLEDGKDMTIYRYGLADRKIEHVASFKDLGRPLVSDWYWFGLAPDDSPLAMRDLGTHEIYAFDILH